MQSGTDSAQARMIPENETTILVSRDEIYKFGFNDEGVVDHLIISYIDGKGFRLEKLGSERNQDNCPLIASSLSSNDIAV